MKTIIITAALIGAFSAAAANAKTVLGCEVIDMGGYSNKADPSCQFANTTRQSGSVYAVIDPDMIPFSGDETSIRVGDGNKD